MLVVLFLALKLCYFEPSMDDIGAGTLRRSPIHRSSSASSNLPPSPSYPYHLPRFTSDDGAYIVLARRLITHGVKGCLQHLF